MQMSPVAMCKRVMSHIQMSHVATYKYIMLHIEMSHGTHMNESCHMYGISHIWLSHVYIWISHVTNIHEWCHTYAWVISPHKWVTPHICMSHITHTNESCPHINESRHTYKWVTPHICISHVQPITFGVLFLHFQISIDNLVLKVSLTTFCWKEPKEIEIGDWD